MRKLSDRYKARWARQAAKQRDAIGLCRYSGCESSPEPDRKYCKIHLDYFREKEESRRRAKGAKPRITQQQGLDRGTRRCIRCRQVRGLDEFENDASQPSGKGYRCRGCSSRHQQDRNDRSRYGLSSKQIQTWSESLGHRCQICGKPQKNNRRLCVDHDHKTGRVRGLLCDRCNRVLGWVEEDPALLRDLIRYLKRHK